LNCTPVKACHQKMGMILMPVQAPKIQELNRSPDIYKEFISLHATIVIVEFLLIE
jgi:hypothetical protein